MTIVNTGARLISTAILALSLSAAFGAAPTTASIMAKANAQAKKEKKNVLVIWHASWCGWCHKLDDMLASKEVGPTMSKAYVIVHLVVDEDPKHKDDENSGAADLRKTLGGETAGLPFFAVLDTKGKNLATSIAGKAGNIGYPAAPSEIAHFMSMMKDTTPQLSDAERTSISAYLADVAVKQKLVPPAAAAGGGRR